MVMERSTFPWTLTYDEMDYVIEGRLDILVDGQTVSARAGRGAVYPQGHLHPVFGAGQGPVPLFRLPGQLAKLKAQRAGLRPALSLRLRIF